MEIVENIIIMLGLVYLSVQDIRYYSIAVRDIIVSFITVFLLVMIKMLWGNQACSLTSNGEYAECVPDMLSIAAFFLISGGLIAGERLSWIGIADVFLIMLCMILKGVWNGLVILLLSVIMAFVTGVVMNVIFRKRYKSMPYIPFVSTAYVIVEIINYMTY